MNIKNCNICKKKLSIEFFKKKKSEYSKCCIDCLEIARVRTFKNTLKNKDKFLCGDCEYRCSTSGDLKKHINRVHLKIKNFECGDCEFKFSTNGDLNQHIKAVHLKIKNFECEDCEYRCSAKGQLTQHIKAIHLKIKNFECVECPFKCSANYDLKRHIKICTGKMNCSSGEYKIMEILKKLNIKYEYNTSYKVKDISFLRWDFIIEINNKKAFVEYDGIQHYEPIRFGSMTYNKALECYNSTVARDNLKNEFCEENNFKLLRISYLEKEECEKLIQDFIKNV